MGTSFSGPIPPPALLSGYEEICKGAADRIIKMAEGQMSHRHKIEKRVIDSNIKHEGIGMWLAFFLSAGLMVAGFILLLLEKHAAVAYLAIFGPAVFNVGNYIYNKGKENSLKREDDK